MRFDSKHYEDVEDYEPRERFSCKVHGEHYATLQIKNVTGMPQYNLKYICLLCLADKLGTMEEYVR